MTTTSTSDIYGSNRDGFTVSQSHLEYEGMTIPQWKAKMEESGFTIRENTDIEKRVYIHQGRVFSCKSPNENYTNVVAWEETW